MRPETVEGTKNSKAIPDRPPTVQDAINTVKIQDLSWPNIMKMPCAKSSLLTGLATSVLLASTRFLVTKRVSSAINWGMFSFLVTSSISWYLFDILGAVNNKR